MSRHVVVIRVDPEADPDECVGDVRYLTAGAQWLPPPGEGLSALQCKPDHVADILSIIREDVGASLVEVLAVELSEQLIAAAVSLTVKGHLYPQTFSAIREIDAVGSSSLSEQAVSDAISIKDAIDAAFDARPDRPGRARVEPHLRECLVIARAFFDPQCLTPRV